MGLRRVRVSFLMEGEEKAEQDEGHHHKYHSHYGQGGMQEGGPLLLIPSHLLPPIVVPMVHSIGIGIPLGILLIPPIRIKYVRRQSPNATHHFFPLQDILSGALLQKPLSWQNHRIRQKIKTGYPVFYWWFEFLNLTVTLVTIK